MERRKVIHSLRPLSNVWRWFGVAGAGYLVVAVFASALAMLHVWCYSRQFGRGHIPPESLDGEVGMVIGAFGNWFKENKRGEENVKEEVTPSQLRQVLQDELVTRGVDWAQHPLVRPLLLYRIIDFPAPFVVLVEDRPQRQANTCRQNLKPNERKCNSLAFCCGSRKPPRFSPDAGWTMQQICEFCEATVR